MNFKSKKKRKIRILHSLARSGGTLVSKCLGCMNNVVLLSEIHPKYTKANIYSPLVQSYKWHNLISEEEIFLLKDLDFVEIIKFVEDRCFEEDKILLIRSWSHPDFMRHSVLKPFSKRKFSINGVLKDSFEIRQISLVRHPVDQWLSLESYGYLEGKYSIQSFLAGYAQFSKLSSQTGFVRYEDFADDPSLSLKHITEKLEIKYDPTYIDKWANYNSVTGDNQMPSRGSTLNEIRPLARRQVPESALREFLQSKRYYESVKLLGYQD